MLIVSTQNTGFHCNIFMYHCIFLIFPDASSVHLCPSSFWSPPRHPHALSVSVPCIWTVFVTFCCCSKALRTGQPREESVYLGFWFQRCKSPSLSWKRSRHGLWSSKPRAHSLKHKQKQRMIGKWLEDFNSLGSLPGTYLLSPAKPHFLNLPNSVTRLGPSVQMHEPMGDILTQTTTWIVFKSSFYI